MGAPLAMVGASGFEPPTSWSRTRRANRTAPRPADRLSRYGAPGETRTPNLLIRSQMLYPIELRAPAFLDTAIEGVTTADASRSAEARPP